jgi:uncharacterized protein YbjT (DUF2867 family)
MFVIAGVTGKTGGVAAAALLEKQQPVRVIVRNIESGRSWRERGAEVAEASLDDVVTLSQALSGARGAYLLIPPDLKSPDYLGRGRRIIGACAEALAMARVPHVVFLSSIGAQHETGTGPVRILHEAERRIAGLRGTKCSFVRAAYFMENLGPMVGLARSEGVLPCIFDPSRRTHMIATADVGRTIAQALMEPPTHRQVIESEALKEYSYTDAAEILSKLLGSTVSAVRVPGDDVVSTLMQGGLSESMASLFKEMAGALDAGKMRFEGGHARHVRGPTTLEAVLRRYV